MSCSFDESEELKMLRQPVFSFAKKEIAPVVEELDKKEEFSLLLVKKMGDLGLFGTIVSSDFNGRLSIAAMGLGLAKGAFELSLKYSGERETSGVPINKHQIIAFRLADKAKRIEAAAGILYKACWLKKNSKPFQKLAAMLKLHCAETADFCAREGQQIFGDYYLMKEYPIERYYTDAALLRIGEGTSEVQRLVASRYIGGL